jgi:uncharacterized BrkB/YihY/UPF0761 family membrane protein
MKNEIEAQPGFWKRRRISLIIALVLLIGVIIFGLHDIGIVLGILMGMVIMIELARRWRRIKNFIILFFSCVFGIALLSFLDEEVIKPFVLLIGGTGAVDSRGFEIFNQLVSLIILFFGVAGLLTGFFGTIIIGIRRLVNLINKRGREANT